VQGLFHHPEEIAAPGLAAIGHEVQTPRSGILDLGFGILDFEPRHSAPSLPSPRRRGRERVGGWLAALGSPFYSIIPSIVVEALAYSFFAIRPAR
jgi:hypothetical protein